MLIIMEMKLMMEILCSNLDGEKIGQGIVTNFFVAEDDEATGTRTGGFGSTS